MERKNILISIIVPVYNVEKEIKKCLNSILEQTHQKFEVLLINDGSTDKSKSICEEFVKKDQRFLLFNFEKNRGPSFSRNIGVERSKGKYLLFVDSDDFIEKCSCERLLNKAEDFGADIVVGDYYLHLGTVKKCSYSNLNINRVYGCKEFLEKVISADEFHCEQWLNLYLRNYWINSNLRFKEGIYFEDLEICLRQILAAKRIVYCNFAFYHYVRRNHSIMSSLSYEKKYRDIQYVYTVWKSDINLVEDSELRKILYSLFAKCLIHSYADLSICQPVYKYLTPMQIVYFSKGIKNILKSVFYVMCPKLYINLYWRKNEKNSNYYVTTFTSSSSERGSN